MFYVLSKIAFFCIAPSHVSLIILAIGITLLWWGVKLRLARWFVTASFVGFVIIGFSPLGSMLLQPLEDRFKPPETPRAGEYAGVILLGGFERGDISTARKTLTTTEQAERLIETVRLARKLPGVKIIFTGGSATIWGEQDTARNAIATYFRDMGIPETRIVLESKSRNTWENAVFTRRLIKLRAGARYLLVTSGWHMPRAMGVFRKAGYDVTAYPVDYWTRGPVKWTDFGSMLRDGVKFTDMAAKEWLGLLVYWITGRSNALFPGPAPPR